MSALALVFLSPAAGIIAASIAFPALLVFYFLKLRRRPVRISSTLLWEQAAQDLQVNVPFRWIRPSWLLVLQAIALALLAGALGRPAIDDAWAPSGRVILMIDRSASMSALDGVPEPDALGGKPQPVSRLDEAKRSARDLVRRLDLASGATEAMLIEFASSARVAAPLTRRRDDLLRAIDALRPTDQPGDLASALELARAFVPPVDDTETAAPTPPPTVALFSDGAFSPPSDGLGFDVVGGAFRLTRVGPAPVPHRRDNSGIVALAAQRDEDQPSLAHCFVRLQSVTGVETPARLVVLLDGKPTRALDLKIPGSAAAPSPSPADQPGAPPPPAATPAAPPAPSELSQTIDTF